MKCVVVCLVVRKSAAVHMFTGFLKIAFASSIQPPVCDVCCVAIGDRSVQYGHRGFSVSLSVPDQRIEYNRPAGASSRIP
jgi:hypothetical protein